MISYLLNYIIHHSQPQNEKEININYNHQIISQSNIKKMQNYYLIYQNYYHLNHYLYLYDYYDYLNYYLYDIDIIDLNVNDSIYFD